LKELIPTAIKVNDEKNISTAKVRLETSTSPKNIDKKIFILYIETIKF